MTSLETKDLNLEKLNNVKKTFIQDIYNYENLNLSEDDFKKENSTNNPSGLECRCNALRANKMQM